MSPKSLLLLQSLTLSSLYDVNASQCGYNHFTPLPWFAHVSPSGVILDVHGKPGTHYDTLANAIRGKTLSTAAVYSTDLYVELTTRLMRVTSTHEPTNYYISRKLSDTTLSLSYCQMFPCGLNVGSLAIPAVSQERGGFWYPITFHRSVPQLNDGDEIFLSTVNDLVDGCFALIILKSGHYSVGMVFDNGEHIAIHNPTVNLIPKSEITMALPFVYIKHKHAL